MLQAYCFPRAYLNSNGSPILIIVVPRKGTNFSSPQKVSHNLYEAETTQEVTISLLAATLSPPQGWDTNTTAHCTTNCMMRNSSNLSAIKPGFYYTLLSLASHDKLYLIRYTFVLIRHLKLPSI